MSVVGIQWNLLLLLLRIRHSLRLLRRLRLLILHRRQDQLHLTQIRYRVAQDERIVILQIEFNARAEARALRKKNQVLQLENALNNFTGARRLLYLHRAIILCDDCLLFSEITYALEGQIRARGCNLHVEFLTECIHVTTDLLDIRGRHMNDTSEIQARNLDILHIRVEQLEEIVRRTRLVRVLHANAEFVRIGRR